MTADLITERMEISRDRRLSLAPEALLVETRGGTGAWIPARAVGYDEISAVYRYEARDWSYLGMAALYWGVLLLLILITGAVGRWPWELIAVAVGVAALLVGALGAYRVMRVPRKLLRIEAYGGTLVFPDRTPAFFGSLAVRLPQPPPAPAAPPEAPPHMETPQEPAPDYSALSVSPEEGSSTP